MAEPEHESSSPDSAETDSAEGEPDSPEDEANSEEANSEETSSEETSSEAAPEKADVAPEPAAAPPPTPQPIVQAAYGGLVLSLLDVCVSTFRTPFPSVFTRVLHALFVLGQGAVLGLAVDLFALGLRKLTGKRSWLALLAATAAGSVFMGWLLDRVLSRQADALLDGQSPRALYLAFVFGCGNIPVLTWLLGRVLGKARSHRVWNGLGFIAMLVAGAVNLFVLPDDYLEIHSAVGLCASLTGGACIAPIVAARLAKLGWPAPRVRARSIAAAVFTLVFGLVPPPNAVRLAEFRSPGAFGAWLFASWTWGLPQLSGTPDSRVDARWYERRADRPDRPPSEKRLVKRPPIVILLTIDATRAAAVEEGIEKGMLPAFTELRDQGTQFTVAHSAGSQTAVSLTALFAGKYFSEMKWAKYGKGTSRFEYAASDPTLRFPSILSDAGVSTMKVASLTFLRNEYGVAPGFTEEKVVTSGRQHAAGRAVIEPILMRLKKARPDEPLFIFAHLTEPHAPYDRGRNKTGTDYERYLSEVQAADGFVGRVLQALENGTNAGRAILIVSSDHGEAFGEHGTREHTKTIYEELLRVPLFVWGAGVAHRKVDQPVTLLDLGPTILDIFGVDTPDRFSGESLVPILGGDDVTLTRPVLAEGRLRRALFVDDLKVIVDLRRKTVEAYDLATDPGELFNVYDRDRDRVRPVLAALRAYFEGRSYTEGGYRPLYKP
ncbi:MAG: sulfatase [Polyangiaceae bacterium]